MLDGKLRPPASRERLIGLLLLAVAVAWNAVLLAPELRIGQLPLNDLVFHRAASERLLTSFQRGEPFLDPWVSEWSLGYPLWRSYQPLAHLLGAFVLYVGRAFAEPQAVIAALVYVLTVALPASVYLGALLLGLSAPGAGLAALLVLGSSSAGSLDGYGLGYGSLTWRGTGLYTQLVALHLLVVAMGATARALDGRGRRPLASLLLGLTLLAHIIFGYVAFVSSAILALVGPRGRRAERVVRLATIAAPALVLCAWFVVPLLMAAPIVNHSRWEAAWKWDSHGAPFLLRELVSGRLFDFGRPPVLTLLLGLGTASALVSLREPVARRLLALTGVWLALFFGRDTWGHLLLLAGVPADLHLHRLQGAFQLSAILLAAHGLTHALSMLWSRRRGLAILGSLAIAAACVPLGIDRARYLEQNAAWGDDNLSAYERERADVEAALGEVRKVLAERPGRASAGPAAGWGRAFKVGSLPVYAFLSRDRIDQASFLYHSMSKTSDVMVLRDEARAAHDVAFGIRAVVAPAERQMPAHLRRRSVHGRLAVYEASTEGYFGIVDIQGHYTGPASSRHEPCEGWLASPLPSQGIVLSLDPRSPAGRGVGRWEALPAADPALLTPRGAILSEAKRGETYEARVRIDRPTHVFVKLTWSPDLVVTVDGKSAVLVHVTPGFGAVAVPAGEHTVVVAYRPRRLKPALFLLGLPLFGLIAHGLRSDRSARVEGDLAARLSAVALRWTTPRTATAAALAGLALIALRPLFRGRLIDGHDATEYPPRLVEMTRALADWHVPPIWAPDLANGHGQPLFQFAPPLVYLAAVPFRAIRLGLTDALQLGLALLHGVGALAIYRLSRRLGGSRPAALGGAAAWLFAPYVALDLFVRAAFAEAAAVAVAPLALLGLTRVLDRPKAGRVAAGACGVALVVLAHNAAALLLVPALALVTLVVAHSLPRSAPREPRARGGWLERMLAGGVSILLGLGLSAYFWVPALLEKELVHIDRLREGYLRWTDHAVLPWQLVWPAWGYGVSRLGSADEMSFTLGPVHLLLGIAGAILASRSTDRGRRTWALAFGAAALGGAWLSTDLATFLWARLETLQYLQFPWRALLLPALFLPLLAVPAFERAGPRATAALIALLVLANLSHTEPKGYLTFDDEYYAPDAIAVKGLNTTTREEYEPRWVERRPGYERARLSGLTSPVTVIAASRWSSREELLVRVAAATVVESPTFFYPGWRVTIDGAPTPVTPAPVRGTIRFELPAGEHRVELLLAPTGVRRAGIFVTLLSALLLALAPFLGRRPPPRE